MIVTDVGWVVIGGILIVIGLIGCIVPIIPGPPISYVGVILQQLKSNPPFSERFLIIMALITIAVTVLDYVVPVWGTKRLGGSKAGMWGSTIGVFVGLFCFPPLGIIIGPFVGAVIGELIVGKEVNVALKSGLGSFLGFLTGTLMKLAVSIVLAFYFFANIL